MNRSCVLVLLAACGGDDAAMPDAMLGDPDTLVGTFAVELTPSSQLTTLLGVVGDGPQPVTVQWDASMTDGACELQVPSVPFCSTPCGSDAACVADEVCLAYPTKQDLGEVTVTGVETDAGDTTFTMEAINGSYQPSVALAYPPFDDGAAVTVDAVGLSLTGAGIAPLEITSADPILDAAQPVTLTWTAGDADARFRVALDISHHGGSRGRIVCDAPDTGSLTISGEMIDGLLDLGVAGFPTILLSRHAVGSTVITAGRVDLDVSSEVERPVTIPGLESCTEDNECTPPATCRDDLTCG